MEEMKLYTHEDMLDAVVGAKGTPNRDKYESDISNFVIGDVIKQARQSRNMTQEELGALLGVQRAQVSKIENGKNLTFTTISRIFKAMGIQARLEISGLGKIKLW